MKTNAKRQKAAADDKLCFTEAVLFDSPALAAVKRMFAQLQRELATEEIRLGLRKQEAVGVAED